MSVVSGAAGKPVRYAFLVLLSFSALLIIPRMLSAGAGIHGAKASGMGTAFIAVADDPSALTFNPAGITQIKGTQIYAGGTAIIPSSTYKSPTGASAQTHAQVFFPPYFYTCSDLNTKDLRVGFGISSPFGIGGRDWGAYGPLRYLSTNSSIATVALNPTVAYQLSPSLSIAAGVDYMMAWNESDVMVNQSLVGAGDAKLRASGHGDGWGWNVGLLFTPSPRWSFGFQYRSSIDVTYDGSLYLSRIAAPLQPLFGAATFRSPIRTSNTFPDILGFGVAFRPTHKWTIALDVERYGWSTFDTVTTEVKRPLPAAGITDRQAALDWKDSWTFRTGAEYRPTDRLALRAGYVFQQTQVPGRTLEPSNPDANQQIITIGSGYTFKTVTLDFFYGAQFFETRRVQNGIVNGKFENFAHYFGFALGKKF